jgi:alpha-amylase/alpha-mannosidase (GH57 family)
MLQAFRNNNDPELVLLATDGESYGHHHRFGNMALSYALNQLADKAPDIQVTNPGQYLANFAPTYEAEIHPNTAWSCFHGIGRWKENCGCNSGAHPSWNQKWRKPLRASLDWLAQTLDAFYEERGASFFQDPWKARDLFLRQLVNKAGDAAQQFKAKMKRPLGSAEWDEALALCEMERYRLYMFTSDGWFFDDISGIEPVQILKYAAKAIELAVSLRMPSAQSLEDKFRQRLKAAVSNVAEFGDGAQVYRQWVEPLRQASTI